jgi:hypothetical protein
MRRLLALTTATILLSGCGASYGAGAPSAARALAAKSPAAATAKQAAPSDGGGWYINDGLLVTDQERRVFALLPKALKPTPTTSSLYRNGISNFTVRVGPANQRFWSFSGTRLVSESLFVPQHPSFEYFFSGVFDTETGKMSVYREVLMGGARK